MYFLTSKTHGNMKKAILCFALVFIAFAAINLSSCEKCETCEGFYTIGYTTGTVSKEFCGDELRDKRLETEYNVYVDGVGTVDYITWTCAGN
jgi:hypothetical protein